jgi:hypothetical protein
VEELRNHTTSSTVDGARAGKKLPSSEEEEAEQRLQITVGHVAAPSSWVRRSINAFFVRSRAI